ncbi:MAG: hypothetical protein CVU56_03600 [Deltaproteobacteria bacterium HGW-Deltaproteobacteria-14]|nr:MAG: hypothetical protein CVU56_03600 [Deltaproteobacteria bacterium HGW-Deltaproteobacteria-14]
MFLGGRYRLLSAPLSTGSFGSVFVAEDQRMPRRVAVKILHPQHAENPTVRARFKRELEAACRVSHENVVSVFDIGEDPNLGLYYVMELVRGTPLKDYLTGEPLPWPFVYRVGYQLTRALHAIHGAGIVHRDLKPQNIMLVERSSLDELVKVLDFGIAALKAQDEETADVELTGARMVLGTPPYMSPEQTYMRSDRERLGLEVDPRSDIYSLGVILYEMAAGRRPFSGDAHDIVVAHRLTRPMPLDRMVGVSVPAEFADLVMQCLSKDPKDRPASAKDVVQALKDCEDRPIRRWTEAEDPIDPRELGTQIMEMEPLPLHEDQPQHQTTEPRLAVPFIPPQRVLWAPIGALAAVAIMTVLLLLQRSELPARPDQTAVDRVAQVAPPGAAEAVAARPRDPADRALAPNTSAGATRDEAARQLAGATPAEALPVPGARGDAGGAAENMAAAGAGHDTAGGGADTAAGLAGAAATDPTGVTSPDDSATARVHMVNLMVTTTPSGATVMLGDTALGETPVNLKFETDQSRKLELVLALKKFQDQTVTLAIGPELAGKVIVVNEQLKPRRGNAATGPGTKKDEDPFKDL